MQACTMNECTYVCIEMGVDWVEGACVCTPRYTVPVKFLKMEKFPFSRKF